MRTANAVSVCELFRFATFADILLVTIGSLFAAIEGAGPAAMALVFGGMTNTLVSTIQNGFAQPANGTVADAIPGQVTAEEFESRMAIYSIFYTIIGVLVYVSSVIHITCWQTACERQIHRVRKSFFRAVLRQELSWFDRNPAGELSAKFNDDVERIRDGIGEQFSSIIKYSSSFLTGFVVGFGVSWRLTLVILAVTPILALFSAYLGRMLATSSRREQQKYAMAGALAEEVLVAVRTVFALGGQRKEIKSYTNKLKESKKMAIWKYFRLSVVLGLSMFILYSTYGLALYVAAQLLAVDLITPGSAMTVIMSVMLGASALGNLIPPLQTVAMSMSSARLIYDIIDSWPRIDASNDCGLKLSKVTANVKFENVNFSYPLREDVPVIKNLNFELQQGQTVAFCGRTGSGKSTIMNLLLRFYDPDEGCIYLDNCNLRDLNVAWLRSLAGIVEQEPALFDCSVYENIALGATQEMDKTYARVIEAAKLANAHEFISNLPEGYNTRCGDRGVQMSGGQKQRIAIARALLCDPKILLLDEATSALDSESESIVQSALNRARRGRTTIIIAHRLSTIRDADFICVMESGCIVESGTHDELMAKQMHYYDLVTNQVFSDGQTSDKNDNNEDDDDSFNSVASSNNPTEQSETNSDSDAGLLQDSPDQSQAKRRSQPLQKRSTTSMTKSSQSLRKKSPQAAAVMAVLSRKTPSSCIASALEQQQYQQQQQQQQQSYAQQRKYSSSLYDVYNKPLGELASTNGDKASVALSSRLVPPSSNGTSSGSGRDQIVLPTTRDILRLIKPEMSWLIAAILACILAGALLPTFALFYAQIFDTFSKTGDELLEASQFWALMFVALAAANFVALFLRVFLMSYMIETTLARVRSECFTSIMRQHVGWFDSVENSPQRLTTRLASDVPQIKAVLNARLSSFISGFSTIVAALVIAFYLGWQLAILLTFALPILLYVGYLQMRMSRGDRSLHITRMENASRLATESVEHVKLIQAINQERYFFEKFNRELLIPLKDSLKSARRFGLVYGLSQSVIFFVYAGAFRWGAFLIAREILDPITVFRTFFSIAFTAVAVGQWGGLGGDMSRANYAIALIIKLLNTKPQIDNLSRGGIKPVFKGQVTLQDIYFRYPTRPLTPVLQGLSLTVKPGQTLALVGPSGQGKSTIGSLLLRFYDPYKGAVRIDNYDIRCINLNYLRLNVGLVSQEPCLFKASIKDNILYGLEKSRYSMTDIENAAKLANIHDFIMSLPEQYNTQVGDRGNQMSGGQKQRIAIARTMIRNPTVLILDEATSALDAESEAVVNEALEKAAKGKTCIKIAHRLSTVRDADQIAVLENGSVVEIGSHDELMALGKKGHYFRLMQKQEISK